jgi:hypothetical protein
MVFKEFEGNKRLAVSGRVDDGCFAGLLEYGHSRFVSRRVMRVQRYGLAPTSSSFYHKLIKYYNTEQVAGQGRKCD